MHINWKKTIFIILDLFLAVYLVFAVTSFNKPDDRVQNCMKVDINIADSTDNGFLSAHEIKSILVRNKIYPLSKPMKSIDPRKIEDVLRVSSFVNTAECYKTEDGHVCINITQRMPIVRIKSDNNEDYYLDDHGGIMPNSKYTSDLIIATGYIPQWFAQNYVSVLSKCLMSSDLWRNQIEQINVLPSKGIELVPRVGNHIVYIGTLPESNSKTVRQNEITKYVTKKLDRLEKFYKYGLSKAGWNKYSYINLEFDNQIICKKSGLPDFADGEKDNVSDNKSKPDAVPESDNVVPEENTPTESSVGTKAKTDAADKKKSENDASSKKRTDTKKSDKKADKDKKSTPKKVTDKNKSEKKDSKPAKNKKDKDKKKK